MGALELTAAQAPPVCPLCGSPQAVFAFAERGYRLQRCRDCDLFYIWPYPSAGEQHSRVRTYDYDNLTISTPETYRASQGYYYSTLFPKIARYYLGAARVLDVGVGAGNLLRLVAETNPRAELYGIELNAARAAYVRQTTSAQISEISILDYAPDVAFDVISLVNVFSHVPVSTLFDRLVALLAPGGRLILKVTEMRDTISRSDYHDWEIPDHIQFLGMRTIDYLAERWGLTLEWRERVPIADAMFTRARFAAPGRSGVRNSIKRLALSVPFALPLARRTYKLWKGERFYTSVVVFRRPE
jgi:SAM-dependent methyltransferase